MSRFWEIALNAAWIILVGVTGIWFVSRHLQRNQSPGRFILKLLWSAGLAAAVFFFIRFMTRHLGGGLVADFGPALMMAGAIAACGILLSITWTPQLSAFLFSPLTSLYDGGNEPPDPKPLYSAAVSKRRLKKPLEAIVAIREQLARFPNDFEGVALLAAIQAEDTRDLLSAESTLNHFCDRPEAPVAQIAAALMQLADWHLNLARDADSARVTLERIIARFPGSPQAAQAAQRIARLDGAEKTLHAALDRKAVAVPQGIDNVGLLDSSEFLRPAETDPQKLAAELVRHLEQHPQDTGAREQLAIAYARHYQRLDLATLELNQLIGQAGQSAKKIARWLNLLADLQIQGQADYDTVCETLEQIQERFPETAAATQAQSRLNRLKLELRGQQGARRPNPGAF